MNKFAKGSVAVGAGLVLLLGGGGSLAYWNSAAGLGENTAIDAGELTLQAAGGAWSPELASWVPGDESAYTTTLTLETSGDNIQGTVALDDTSVAVTPADAADQFDITFGEGADATIPSGATLAYDAASQSFSFDGPGTYTIPVTLTVSFPYDEDAEQNASQNAQVDLSDVSFTATQSAATGAVTE